jgi:hypothetical protein
MNITLKANQRAYILPVGDIHRGGEGFNPSYLDYWQDQLQNIKGTILLYFMGDLLEAATKSLSNSAYRQQMSLDDQIDQTISFFQPIINQPNIIPRFACRGNHELRLSKDYDLDVMRIIASALDVPYGHQYIDHISINNQPFNIYISHGRGSSKYHYTAESKIIRDTSQIDADLYLNGHNHRCGYFSLPVRTGDGLRRKHYAFTGAFLSYQGYPDSMHLPILPEAFIHLSVNKDLRVFNNIFYIDERQPELLSL